MLHWQPDCEMYLQRLGLLATFRSVCVSQAGLVDFCFGLCLWLTLQGVDDALRAKDISDQAILFVLMEAFAIGCDYACAVLSSVLQHE